MKDNTSPVPALLLVTLVGCAIEPTIEPALRCGPGTHEADGQCLSDDEADTDADSATDTGGDTGGDADTGGDTGIDTGTDTGTDTATGQDWSFVPSTEPGVIGWSMFPDFTLPEGLIAVWSGPQLSGEELSPLSHGWTHLDLGWNPVEIWSTVDPSQRAIIWTGIGAGSYQPWGASYSPWGNDTDYLESWWAAYMRAYAYYEGGAYGDLPNVDIVCQDIETYAWSDDIILGLRTDANTPEEYLSLDDDAFIDRYKRDMAELYTTPARWVHEQGLTSTYTSYLDTPVDRTWWDITTRTWEDWQTNPEVLSWHMGDFASESDDWTQALGPFLDDLDVTAPSAYYFYDYEDDFSNSWYAGDWLAYLLFQLEVNRAWSDKGQIVFTWNEYHPGSSWPGVSIRPWMAQGTMLFAFIDGAQGVWTYSEEPLGGDPAQDYTPYEYAAYGLWQISTEAEFFGDEAEIVSGVDPVTAMDQDLPIWRGRRLGDRLLVVAQDPYAMPGVTGEVQVEVGGDAFGTVALDGPYPTIVELSLP